MPFHLPLVRPGTGSARFAVVEPSGVAQRPSTGTSASRPSTGSYIVANNLNIRASAAFATRGSVDTGVPYTPATVEISGLRRQHVRRAGAAAALLRRRAHQPGVPLRGGLLTRRTIHRMS